MTEELYKVYRPSTFGKVIGQDAAVKTLTKLGQSGKVPHALLLTGPSGCGKTTIARILKDKLNCSDADYVEKNASEQRGIDTIREIKSKMVLSPLMGKVKVYVIDECQSLTSEAQEAFLKILEDTPKHVYFMLCTTDPQKLKKTIITRCTEIKLTALSPVDVRKLVGNVAEAESLKLSTDVVDAIVDACDGSARKALVLLNSVMSLTEEDDQLEAIQNSSVKSVAFDIAKTLLSAKTFADVAKVLKTCDEDAEQIRRVVLGYCSAVLLGGGAKSGRAFAIIDVFRNNFYDSGKAGLVASCYEVFLEASRR